MTVSRARQILKLDEEFCSDKEVQEIIDETMMLSRFFLDRFVKGEINFDDLKNKESDLFKNKDKLKLFINIGTSKNKKISPAEKD